MAEKEIKDVQAYFESMISDISINKVSLPQFVEYYNNLKNAISSQLVKNPLNYLIALSNAEVFPIVSEEDKEELLRISEDLENAIALLAKKQIESKINLNDYFENMRNIISNQYLSFGQFVKYYNVLELAIMAKVEDVDFVTYAKTLLNAEITATTTYDQNIEINLLKKKLIQYIFKLEQETQHKFKH